MELFLHFPEKRARKGAKSADEPAVVDGTALVNHDLTVSAVPGDPSGKSDAQEVLPRKASGARQDPG